MRRITTFWGRLLLSGALLSGTGWSASDGPVIHRLEVILPETLHVPYAGASREVFPRGMVTGLGSGLALKSQHPDGSAAFYLLSDRGPNDRVSLKHKGEKKRDGQVFPVPDFQPTIGLAVLDREGLRVQQLIGLQNRDGRPLTGLPPKPDSTAEPFELPLNEYLRPLHHDPEGIDPEGIAIDASGAFWICDEYGPAIYLFAPDGRMLRKYSPGRGLPEVLARRRANRGFEGITVTADGMVYAAMQSVLQGEETDPAPFIRLVELDPHSGKTRMFAYPLAPESGGAIKDIQIGDIASLSERRFVVIEQGRGRDTTRQTRLFLVDLTDAADITAGTPQSSPVRMTSKKLLLDLGALGWPHEKTEGIAIFPDKRTLTVINDNDFGFSIAAGKTAVRKNRQAEPIALRPKAGVAGTTQMWNITLPEPLR